MSVSTSIGLVSESLRRLLTAKMSLSPAVSVTVLSPDEAKTDRKINLFLYKIQENPFLKNADWQIKKGDAGRVVPPPLSLNLYYLMTPYAPNDPQTGHSTAHKILGDAMRVFYENPVVPSDYLDAAMKSAGEEVRIMLNTLDLEELSKIWNTFKQPFRLSVLYEISVVQIDPLPEKEKPLPIRVRKVGVPVVGAPFQPPLVSSISPASGPAGSSVSVSGDNLDSWKASVTIGRKTVADGILISGQSFSFTLPANLAPGFHEIRVDVGNLCRRTFFFEVTP